MTLGRAPTKPNWELDLTFCVWFQQSSTLLRPSRIENPQIQEQSRADFTNVYTVCIYVLFCVRVLAVGECVVQRLSQLGASGLWKPPWWTEHGGLTSAPEDGRCAFDWISHKDVLLWSLLWLKAGWIWEALCTAFACPVMKYYSLFRKKLIWKDMEMKQTGLISEWISWQRGKRATQKCNK